MPNDNGDRKNLQGREDNKEDRSLDGSTGSKPEPRSGQDPNPSRWRQGEGSGKPVSKPSASSDESEEPEDR